MAGYLHIEGIPGQSKDAKHQNWINLQSIQEGISRPIAFGGSGSQRNVGSASHSDIVCTKEMDKSTPKLIEAVSAGTTYPVVKIDLCQSLGKKDERPPYMQWELKQVIISSYSVSASLGDGIGTVPTESFSLNFEEAKWTFNEYDKDGNFKGKVEATWKVEEGTT